MKTIFISLLLLIRINSSILATTYYVSNSSGNDSNNGLSSSSPWKTLSKVSSYTFAPGDSILFKEGDLWKEASSLVFTESGTANTPIVISTYGQGNKPIISYNLSINGWNNSNNWIITSPNIWRMKYTPGTSPNRLWINGTETLAAPILADVGITNSQGSFQHWFYNAGDSMLYVYSIGNPAISYTSMEGNALYSLVLYNNSHLIVEGLDIRGGRWQTVYIGRASYITINNCNIGYGRTGVAITSDMNAFTSEHIIIENCNFDSGMNFYFGMASNGQNGSYRGSEDAIALYNAARNCTVRNNTFNGWGHTTVYCIALDPNKSGVYNNKIHNNYFNGSNISYGRPLGTDGVDGKCYNNEFFNNIMKDHTVRSQINGNNNWVHHNIFDGQTTSPARRYGTDGSGQAIELSIYDNDFVCYGNKIDNNLFVNTSEAAIVIRSYLVNHAYNNYIRNNIFYNTGYATANVPDTGIAIRIEDQSQVYNNFFQNNCVYNPNMPPNNAVKLYGTKMNISQFNTLNGSNGNVIQNNLQSNPLFVDYLNRDYHLTPNSPCVDAGITISGLVSDLDGNPIPIGNAPDIGPYEYNSTTSVRTENGVSSLNAVLFPNPFSVSAILEFSLPIINTKAVIYNIAGQEVKRIENISGKTLVIQRDHLPNGTYFLQLVKDNRTILSKKLIIVN